MPGTQQAAIMLTFAGEPRRVGDTVLRLCPSRDGLLVPSPAAVPSTQRGEVGSGPGQAPAGQV